MQNSTPNQMKMLLTRIGNGSKMIVTGDLNQHDIKYEVNGLKDINERISSHKNINGIRSITFDHKDIERSPIVRRVLEIYGDV